jgi:hypothetical protein
MAAATPRADLSAHAAGVQHAPKRTAGREQRQREQQCDEAAKNWENHESDATLAR